jgi:Zn-dependent peptidase ImmA (M78 family)
MKPIVLNENQIEEIRRLASEVRSELTIDESTPIGNDIFFILERLDINLLEYPIKSDNDRPAFSAAIMHIEEEDSQLTFLGLNTADYADKQIFAIAHELYHFYTKTGSHISWLNEDENNLIEAKANRFAAELLLPQMVLQKIVDSEFNQAYFTSVHSKSIFRFIIRLHCTYWLPYRSIVRRLYEINMITHSLLEELYSINERDFSGEYGRIGLAMYKETFQHLNTKTLNIGTSAKLFDMIIRNYDNNLINEDQLAETLDLFDRHPTEFGYDIEIPSENMDEIVEYFGSFDDYES